jgi:hypothetical protein
MKLKDKFLIYVEYQRTAELFFYTEGALSSNTKSMFEEANRRKQELLEMFDQVEELEYRMRSLEK